MSQLQIPQIRPACPDDRDAVFAMVATVWDGTDYIPAIWNEWLTAEDGPLLVGTLDERPVTLCKLTALSDDEDWLEGVRVDPEFRGQGLARAIVRYCIGLSRQRGKRTLRYITSETNETMQRLGPALGFRLCYAPLTRFATAIEAQPSYRTLPPSLLPELLDDLAGSPLLQLTGGLYTYGWTAYELTETRLRGHLEKGHVVELPGAEAWAIIEPSQRGGWWIAHAEGMNGELEQLFRALRSTPEPFAGEHFVRIQVPLAAPFTPALLAAGYTADDHGACIYERILE